MKSNKKKYYVVWEGNNVGVFNTWDECKLQTKNYKGAKYKSFATLKELIPLGSCLILRK